MLKMLLFVYFVMVKHLYCFSTTSEAFPCCSSWLQFLVNAFCLFIVCLMWMIFKSLVSYYIVSFYSLKQLLFQNSSKLYDIWSALHLCIYILLDKVFMPEDVLVSMFIDPTDDVKNLLVKKYQSVMVKAKINILSSFTHQHAAPNKDGLSSSEYSRQNDLNGVIIFIFGWIHLVFHK